jgi:transcriptional regulator with XRE-family HTH domain
MTGGRRPHLTLREEAARLRAQGLSLKEVGRRLGMTRQGASSLLRPLRGTPAVACPLCGAAIVSAGALPRDAGTALCLTCLAQHRGASFGQRLKSFRLAAGLLQKELSRKAGVCEPTIRSCEVGRHRPQAVTLARLAGALGVPPEALEVGGPVPERLRQPT